MDTIISKTKAMIPGLGWRLVQAEIFSVCFATLATFLKWLEYPVLDDLLYAPIYFLFVMGFTTTFLWVFAIFYEGRRKKWLAENGQQ